MISIIFLYTLPLTALHSRLTALFVSYSYLGPYIVSVGLAAANAAGHTKKVTVNALIFMVYYVSNIVRPFFFKAIPAPLYPMGMTAMLVSYEVSMILICIYMSMCYFDNRKRDAEDAARGEPVHPDTEFKDLTHKQNIHFRYLW
jgi:ACS family allantoate permease-like MFS transporter